MRGGEGRGEVGDEMGRGGVGAKELGWEGKGESLEGYHECKYNVLVVNPMRVWDHLLWSNKFGVYY